MTSQGRQGQTTFLRDSNSPPAPLSLQSTSACPVLVTLIINPRWRHVYILNERKYSEAGGWVLLEEGDAMFDVKQVREEKLHEGCVFGVKRVE